MENPVQEGNRVKKMEIRYVLPNHSRPRVFRTTWKKGMVEAFRELFKVYPNANPISFNGHTIKTRA